MSSGEGEGVGRKPGGLSSMKLYTCATKKTKTKTKVFGDKHVMCIGSKITIS